MCYTFSSQMCVKVCDICRVSVYFTILVCVIEYVGLVQYLYCISLVAVHVCVEVFYISSIKVAVLIRVFGCMFNIMQH